MNTAQHILASAAEYGVEANLGGFAQACERACAPSQLSDREIDDLCAGKADADIGYILREYELAWRPADVLDAVDYLVAAAPGDICASDSELWAVVLALHRLHVPARAWRGPGSADGWGQTALCAGSRNICAEDVIRRPSRRRLAAVRRLRQKFSARAPGAVMGLRTADLVRLSRLPAWALRLAADESEEDETLLDEALSVFGADWGTLHAGVQRAMFPKAAALLRMASESVSAAWEAEADHWRDSARICGDDQNLSAVALTRPWADLEYLQTDATRDRWRRDLLSAPVTPAGAWRTIAAFWRLRASVCGVEYRPLGFIALQGQTDPPRLSAVPAARTHSAQRRFATLEMDRETTTSPVRISLGRRFSALEMDSVELVAERHEQARLQREAEDASMLRRIEAAAALRRRRAVKKLECEARRRREVFLVQAGTRHVGPALDKWAAVARRLFAMESDGARAPKGRRCPPTS